VFEVHSCYAAHCYFISIMNVIADNTKGEDMEGIFKVKGETRNA